MPVPAVSQCLRLRRVAARTDQELAVGQRTDAAKISTSGIVLDRVGRAAWIEATHQGVEICHDLRGVRWLAVRKRIGQRTLRLRGTRTAQGQKDRAQGRSEKNIPLHDKDPLDALALRPRRQSAEGSAALGIDEKNRVAVAARSEESGCLGDRKDLQEVDPVLTERE